MNVLIVGSGGREHAIAWKITQSPHLTRLWTAPGNAGTSRLGENVPLDVEDVEGLVHFARRQAIDLVIIGPEASLAAGLTDALQKAGIRVFGPTTAAAQIESSKTFSKEFMRKYGIPTARFSSFTGVQEAMAFLDTVEHPVVIKASGLAAGKGVVLPETTEKARAALQSIMVERVFGEAGDAVVIEERLSGEEVSLMAFTDGSTVLPMLPAQDHKRIFENDQGPNTGGMGAYAPAPICPPEMVEEITRAVLQPAVDGLRSEGVPFIGVLYAGLMFTEHGVKVLEFNCRFGDPETQVVLPLLENDLLEVFDACVDGRLDQLQLRWREGSAVTVVLASQGYPGKYPIGRVIHGLKEASERALVFHAGTKVENDAAVTAGGRVLNVTTTGPDLVGAVDQAYAAVKLLSFEGMQYRRDIAQKAMVGGPAPHTPVPQTRELKLPSAYASSGVDIDAGNRAVNLMKEAVRSTYSPAVLAGIGAFGGLFDAEVIKSARRPVLVASTDGVGTKVRLAAKAGRYESLGEDIVNHCIDDILVQGARPLFFMDYFATSMLKPEMVASVVTGIAKACREAGCVLLGGETAEMPGVYSAGEFDIAGTIVGLVEQDAVLPRGSLLPGDLLVGLASSGPHTNGYSLIRKIFAGVPLETVYPELGIPLADALLAPHRSYLALLAEALACDPSPVKALAHLTGGGFIENIPRVLPDGLRAQIHKDAWIVPPLFRLIQSTGQVEEAEMYRVFNMGIGMVAVVAPDRLAEFQNSVRETTWVIGALASGEKGVELL